SRSVERGADIHDDDARPLFCHQMRDRAADAAPATGDDGNLAREDSAQLPDLPCSAGMNNSFQFAGLTLIVPARCRNSAKAITPLGVEENRVSGSSRIFRTSSSDTFTLEERTKVSAAAFLFAAMKSHASSSAARKAAVVFGLASTKRLDANTTSSVILPSRSTELNTRWILGSFSSR